MFTRAAVNPYDEIIAKATDEKQTEINWEIALTVWDKVNDDGEQGARNCVAALQKRLNHRSANVQLFSLTLAGALVNNCGDALHREISGKVFTQTLVRLINDRNTHETVKNSALSSIETWVKDHPSNPSFDLLLDTYESLKRQGHVFPSSAPPRAETPKGPSDDQLRREEEELQRALEESRKAADPMKGYRRSSPNDARERGGGGGEEEGFVPPAAVSSAISEPAPARTPKRARALFDFEGQTAEELPLRRGEEVRVLEEVSADWWRGESERTGRRGIFPTNYVESLPDLPSSAAGPPHQQPPHAQGPEDLEAEIFAQAASIDRLLQLMHQVRAQGGDFADNDEVTDLYNTSMRLRPKVVQLIRNYEQKQADLQGLSDNLSRAKAAYEQATGLPSSQPYPQQNGFPSSQPAQHPPHAQPWTQPQQQPPPRQAPQADPAQQQRDYEEEQRREYERKYAEYERQLEEYNRQMAQIAQQQHPAPSADPSQQHPPSHAPVSAASPAPHPHAHPHLDPSPAPAAQPQPQPIWDGHAWVWPAQHAAPAPAETHLPPAPAMSPVPVPAATAGYPVQAQPYEQQPVGSPVPQGYAVPPVQPQHPPQGYQLADGMAALSVSSPAGPGSPPPAVPVVAAGSPAPHVQQQQAYYQQGPVEPYQPVGHPQQQFAQAQDPNAAAWAAWHAAQAQQAQQAPAQGYVQGPESAGGR
ncbi:hypothetical protein JCM10213_008339 [Rhodosporidiobolus nylandii]